jgi:hypothetical protein
MATKISEAPDKIVMGQLYEEFKTIKSRQGRGGKNYDYIKSADVIDRLNKVLGLRWSVEEVDSQILGNWIVMRVRIIVQDPDSPDRFWIREGYGGHPFNPNSDPADAYKSAYSKAITKAASLFGVGLYLWGLESDQDDDQVPFAGPYEQPAQQAIQQGGWSPPTLIGTQTPVQNQGPAQPNMYNPQVPMSAPPVPQQQAPIVQPPIMHNRQPGLPIMQADMSGAIGQAPGPQFPGGPPGPAAAQVAFQPVQQQTDVIADYQKSAIKGMSQTVGFADPVQMVKQALGHEVDHIQAVDQLSNSQAIRVLQWVREAQTQRLAQQA